MAKITVAGQAVVVTLGVALEDIKTIKKYRPDALILKGGEDGKEEIFRIGVGEGGINKFGASFDHETRDDKKYAVVTMTTNYEGDDIKGFIADEIGAAITNINKLEATFPAVLEEIKKERAEIMGNITVA